MIEGRLRSMTLSDRDESWEDVEVMRPIVKMRGDADPWGVLAPLKGTRWEKRIPVVSGAVFSHALHGRLTPLMNALGPRPQLLAKRFSDVLCALREGCLAHDAKRCRFAHVELPECYEPDLDRQEAHLGPILTVIAQAWSEGRYVLIVEGEEFNYA